MALKLDREEFNKIYYSYVNLLYSVSYSYVHSKVIADDIVQDVFVKLLLQEKSFNSNDYLKNWLVRVCINQCKDYLKHNNLNVEFNENMMKNENKNNDLSEAVFKEVMNLKPKYKDVVILFYYQDFSLKEIAELLNCKVMTIGKRLQRARDILKVRLNEYEFR